MTLCLNCRSEAAKPNFLVAQIPHGTACSRCGYTPDGLPSIDEVREWVAKKMKEERR